ncbi:16754_t:CDS:2, partial [Racocetra persica]
LERYSQLQKLLDKELNALIEVKQLLLNTRIKYYQNISYSIIESNSNYQYVKFCVDEVVKTVLSNNEKSAFRIIKEIIKNV